VPNLARNLERVRLAQRAERIERVLVALREQHRERSLRDAVPAPLSQSIAEFAARLAQVHAEQRASSLAGEAGAATP
jgi:hypothetical protein